MLSVSEDGWGAKELRGNKWGKNLEGPLQEGMFTLVWAQSPDSGMMYGGGGERQTSFWLLSSLWFGEKLDKNWKKIIPSKSYIVL